MIQRGYRGDTEKISEPSGWAVGGGWWDNYFTSPENRAAGRPRPNLSVPLPCGSQPNAADTAAAPKGEGRTRYRFYPRNTLRG